MTKPTGRRNSPSDIRLPVSYSFFFLPCWLFLCSNAQIETCGWSCSGGMPLPHIFKRHLPNSLAGFGEKRHQRHQCRPKRSFRFRGGRVGPESSRCGSSAAKIGLDLRKQLWLAHRLAHYGNEEETGQRQARRRERRHRRQGEGRQERREGREGQAAA